jgi:hypothetical protein
MRPTRFLLPLVIALAASCGGSVDSLDGAIGQIPIFAPASFKERSTSLTSDDMGDPTKFSTYTWYLETEKTPDEVAAFYMAQWPGAGRTDDEEDATIFIRNPPLPEDDGAPLGESVSVTINRTPEGGKTQFYISEDVFRAKRRN